MATARGNEGSRDQWTTTRGHEGSWTSSDGDARHEVIGEHCTGLARCATFVVIDEYRCATELFGQRCCGKLTPDGAAICWEDGGVWWRTGAPRGFEKQCCEGSRPLLAAAFDEARGVVNDADPGCCTVCFEELSAVGGAVELPCDCKALYCHTCWDHALNAKYDQTKMAQCPTCRCAMRVDFDASTSWLRFTQQEKAEPDPDMRARLQEQTKPYQVALLQEHGDSLAEYCFSRAAAGRPRTGLVSGPSCICGNHLVLTSVRDRVVAFVAQHVGVAREEAEQDKRVLDLTEKFLNGHYEVPLTCDICQCIHGNRRVQADGRVWTCEAGNTTLLHGLSYDVCEACYACHVGDSTPQMQ